MEENMNPTSRRRPALALLLPAAALALSGCAVGFSPNGAPDVTGDEPSAPVDAPVTEETPGDDVEADTMLTREQIAAAVTKQVTCGGGDLEVADIGSVVEVVDDCATLTVTGDGSVVLGAGVEQLDISAVAAVVFVASVDSVTLTGDGTTVLWESGSPRIDDSSFGSTLVGAGR